MESAPRRSARGGILAGPVDGSERLAAAFPRVPGVVGMTLTHRGSGFRGSLVSCTATYAEVRGSTGLTRRFPVPAGAFLVDGAPVSLVPPADIDLEPERAEPANVGSGRVSVTQRTASGSRAVVGAKARVARASRIWVEGVHDAELLEQVWGDDLRVEGIVVERLDGIDHLDDAVVAFAPGPRRRLGVLVDHLVAGSKEERLAARVRGEHVIVAGTPYVDIWAAIRPAAVGIPSWPEVPMGVPWKEGVCAALRVEEPREFWPRILGAVRDWRDLEQPLIAAVETLIDFVSAGGDPAR